MRINLYLHYPDDTDLMILKHVLGRCFGQEVIKAVQSEALGLHYLITFEPDQEISPPVLEENFVSIKISDERYPDVVRYINALPNTQRCIAIKNIIRRSCSPFPVRFFEKKPFPKLILCLDGKRDKDLLTAYEVLGKEGIISLVKMAVSRNQTCSQVPFHVKEQKLRFHTVYLEIPVDRKTDNDLITFLSSIEPDLACPYIKILIRRFLIINYSTEHADPQKGKKPKTRKGYSHASQARGETSQPDIKQVDSPATIPDALKDGNTSDKSTEELTNDVFDIFEDMS